MEILRRLTEAEIENILVILAPFRDRSTFYWKRMYRALKDALSEELIVPSNIDEIKRQLVEELIR